MAFNPMDILAGLNPAQRQAVQTIQGPLLILAGPGSGKTRVITHRVAYLIKVCGINPHRIMAVTFTNKAANEMRERLERLLGQTSEALTLGTFHAICAGILRREGKVIGLDPRFVIYDEEDQLTLIKQSLLEVRLDPKHYTPRAIQSAIKAAKSRGLSPKEYAHQTHSYFDEVVHRVYEHYQQLLTRSQAVDFDDLLLKTVQLFAEHPEVLNRYQSRYLHILVDEFQDTNITQYILIKQLAGKYRNICVVGDPDQSIYSWRFADLRNILSFEKDYPDTKVVFLEQNYRSTKTVLEIASHIISANLKRKPKSLWTENETGVAVAIVETYSEDEEAQFVVGEIEKLASDGEASLRDCAVMYRVNAQSRALEEAFMRYGVPYKLVGGTRFYQRREIKDIIAYLRVLHNPSDNISLMRIINIPGRGIGQRTLAELSAWARSQNISLYHALKASEEKEPAFTPRTTYALNTFFNLMEELRNKSKELSLSELVDEVLESTGYQKYLLGQEDGEERWENVLELRAATEEYGGLSPEEALATFLEKVTLVSDVDELDEKAEAVTLITLHQAKGLEFPVVFIVGMEEGVLPHRKSFDDPEEIEEERRLCYVGVTRAQKQVYLLRAYRRSFLGGSSLNPPSRFLKDIPPHLVTIKGLWEEELFAPVAAPSPRRFTLLSLKIGEHVHHKIFGEGEVIDCSRMGDDQVVTVTFKEAGTKKLLLSLAPLKKVEKAPEFRS